MSAIFQLSQIVNTNEAKKIIHDIYYMLVTDTELGTYLDEDECQLMHLGFGLLPRVACNSVLTTA